MMGGSTTHSFKQLVFFTILSGALGGYSIKVKTGNWMRAGTDAHVFIKLYGHLNQGGSQWVRLDQPGVYNDFETGSEHEYTIADSAIPNVGVVYQIEIKHDKSGLWADWHLEWVKVVDYNRGTSGVQYDFPCNCWLDDHNPYRKLSRRVNGQWGGYGSYGSCSASCGSGTMTRFRQCNQPPPYNGGASCSGSNAQSMACLLRDCPVNGGWSSWSGYQSCTTHCGGGTQTRVRTCTQPRPQHGGKPCPGVDTETKACNAHDCPVHGQWSDWGPYSECPVTCGGGTQISTRACDDPEPAHGGQDCYGSSNRTQPCNNIECPVNGGWGNWSQWSNCSDACGGGDQIRRRTCDNPPRAHGGLDCNGDPIVTRSCNIQPCIVNGGWSVWTNWTTCSSSCGGGIQSSNRTCTVASCEGNTTRYQPCHSGACPVDGGWSGWGNWSECSVTCDGGTQFSLRTCTEPRQSNGGKDCDGLPVRHQNCNTEPCPVNGSWTDWGAWTPCPVTCGGSLQVSVRTCSDPPPSSTGLDCVGNATRLKKCNEKPCPVNGKWDRWSPWSTCSRTCEGGLQSRSRSCSDPTPANGGRNCSGDTEETRECNTDLCPGDGAWSGWSSWSGCSEDCDTGTSIRVRSCADPAPSLGGKECEGDGEENRKCNIQPCSDAVITKKGQALQSQAGDDGEGALSKGGIIGISVTAAVLLIIIAIIAALCVAQRTRRRKEQQRQQEPEDFQSVAYINNIYEEIPAASGAASVVNPNFEANGHTNAAFDARERKVSLDEEKYMSHPSIDPMPAKHFVDVDDGHYMEPTKASEKPSTPPRAVNENDYVEPSKVMASTDGGYMRMDSQKD